MNNLNFKLIDPINYFNNCVELLSQLNPKMELSYIENTLKKMTELPGYKCFGLFENNELIGISSGWTSIRIYCGKQLELDNVIINKNLHSKGLGNWFLDKINNWASQNEYDSIELNTYVENSRSHKFYFNQGYKILGYHFQKKLN